VDDYYVKVLTLRNFRPELPLIFKRLLEVEATITSSRNGKKEDSGKMRRVIPDQAAAIFTTQRSFSANST